MYFPEIIHTLGRDKYSETVAKRGGQGWAGQGWAGQGGGTVPPKFWA